ncbi:9442_t:CDS:2 [Funneliformis caledonium]|uniref:9442_t:CDS:1 n=1 Tax=Funneliformis caledonium TaxID=1117310 RepID=A0A9N8ZFX6_9GLOM|nr:9442_t:CDS:2 [Funneliformis caledonium]
MTLLVLDASPTMPPDNYPTTSFLILPQRYHHYHRIFLNNVYFWTCMKNVREPKIKTSLEYGIIDLNDGIILEALGQSVILHFEVKMQEYKPKKSLSVEVMKTLKIFNVTSLEDLERALTKVKIEYNNLDHDIVYLRCLFEKFGEVESFVQKLIDKKSRKKKKYDGILFFSRQFEFIFIETATTSILSKSDKDLLKLHNAIVLMFKHMVSTLPEKLLHEISSCQASIKVYLASWLTNMRPVVFSIMDFEIAEEITTFLKMTKVAAKMLSLRPFIQDLHKRYQILLMKKADYYLDDENTWTSPLRMKAYH